MLLIKIATIFLHISLAVLLQTASPEDELHPPDAPASPPPAAVAPPPTPTPPPLSFSESSESPSEPPVTTAAAAVAGTAPPDQLQPAEMWSFDLLNYSAICSLYDSNVQYLGAAKNNAILIYQYLEAQFVSLLTLASSSTENENYAFLSRLSWSALSYHLYTLQTVLFRTETVAILCIVLIAVLILHSLFHYRERQKQAAEFADSQFAPPPYSPPQSPSTSATKSPHFLARIYSHLNFTILFSNISSFVDSTFRNFRSTEAIITQQSYGHAGVYSMQGRRPNMEDCFTLKNNVSKDLGIDYYAVYDGHGGPNAALQAEKEIFDSISKRIKEILAESNKENSQSASSQVQSPSLQSSSKSVPSSPTKSTPTDGASCPATPSTTSPPQSSLFIPSLTNHKSASSKTVASRFDSLTVNAMKAILHDEICKVDSKLVEQFRKRSDISGSTAVLAVRLVHSNILLVANVGDSRAILCDWKWATIPLSFDHKPYQLKEYRRIVEAGGYIMLKGVYRVNGILAVSRALGDYPLKEDRLVIADPDILSFDLTELKARFMIVASDGFWDTFSNENAVQFVRTELARLNAPNFAESQANLALYIAKKLANEAYTRESYDNITVIVVLFEEVQPGASPSSCGGKIKIGQASSGSSSPT